MKRIGGIVLSLILVLTMLPLSVGAKEKKAETIRKKEMKGTFSYTLPKKSTGGYQDVISWRAGVSYYSGEGRCGRMPGVVLRCAGNTVSGEVTGLLDYEDWQVKLTYHRTYFWKEEVPVYGWYKTCSNRDEDHTCSFPACYSYGQTGTETVKRSGQDSGSVIQTGQTKKDPCVYDQYDLLEKVHKYRQLYLVNDIEVTGEEGHVAVDGAARGRWLHENIDAVTIHGKGRQVRYTGEGSYCFQVGNDATLQVEDLKVASYKGRVIDQESVGGEYRAKTAEGGGGAFMAGRYYGGEDQPKDPSLYSKGNLILDHVDVDAFSKAVYIARGSVRVRDCHLYGMGQREIFTAHSQTEGSGICVGEPAVVLGDHSHIQVENSTIIGRFNGIFVQGNTDCRIRSSILRGDCGDCIDQRGRGDVVVEDCRLYGAKGIDSFHDAECDAITEALGSRRTYSREKYLRGLSYVPKEKRGQVLLQRCRILVYTGVFPGNEDLSGVGIQCNGKVTLGEKVEIEARHSGAWYKKEGKGVAAGISTAVPMEIPEDTRIYGDDDGIKTRRELADLQWGLEHKFEREYKSLPKGQVEKDLRWLAGAYDLLGQGTKAEGDFDDGGACRLKVRGEVISGNTGILNAYGRVALLSGARISGVECGIKNGVAGLFEDKEMVDYEQLPYPSLVIGTREKGITIASSSQGKAVVNQRCAIATLDGLFEKGKEPGVLYTGMDMSGACGTGIANAGRLYLHCGVLQAAGRGIDNAKTGVVSLWAGKPGATSRTREEAAVCICDGQIGIANRGRLTLGSGVNISGNTRAGVWQKGDFVMKPGAGVDGNGEDGNPIFLDRTREEGQEISHVIDVYGKLYDIDPEGEEGSCGRIALGEKDRALGREMIRLFSEDGSRRYFEEDPLEEKGKILECADRLCGGGSHQDAGHRRGLFTLDFDAVEVGKDRIMHKSALRSGLGDYGYDKALSEKYQPKEKERQNGRVGTVVLSALFQATYHGNIKTSVDGVVTEDPKPTPFYWREATDFTTESDHRETDRSRIFYEKGGKREEISCAFVSKGWSDQEEKPKELWHEERIRRIYEEDHDFYEHWDMDVDLYFHGNGQTNGAKNYRIRGFGMGDKLPGNDGADHTGRPYFEKEVAGRSYDKNAGEEVDKTQRFSWQGWSLKDDSIYTEEGVLQEGKELPPDTMEFFLLAVRDGHWKIEEKRAVVTLYAVWDAYPEISAIDGSIYDEDLRDHSEKKKQEIMEKLLSPERVRAFDREDGAIPRENIRVYTDLKNKRFDLEDLRNLGDLGSASIFYEVEDKWEHPKEGWQVNKSVFVAKLFVLTSDSMDSKEVDDKMREDSTESGGSDHTEDAAPVFVRKIDAERQGLVKYSVWKDRGYKRELSDALFACEKLNANNRTGCREQREEFLSETSDRYEKTSGYMQQRWLFTGEQIKACKKYTRSMGHEGISGEGLALWQEKFGDCKILDKPGVLEENPGIFCEEGNRSLRINWEVFSDADRIDLTLEGEDGSRITRQIRRGINEEEKTETVVSDLQEDQTYRITMETFSGGRKAPVSYALARTRGIDPPKVRVRSEGEGKLGLYLTVDGDASVYRIQRRCCKQMGEKKRGNWEDLAVLDEKSIGEGRHFDPGHREAYYRDQVEPGIYEYRIRGEGRQLSDTPNGKIVLGPWSDAREMGYVPEVSGVEGKAGYKSILVEWKEPQGCDGYKITWEAEDGPVKEAIVRGDEKQVILRDLEENQNYQIRVYGQLGGYESLRGREYHIRTGKLDRPRILSDSKGYQEDGIHLSFAVDSRGELVQILRRKEGEEETIVKEMPCSKDGRLDYVDQPVESGCYIYRIKVWVRDPDEKHRFEKISAGKKYPYIRPLYVSGKSIPKGEEKVVKWEQDPDAKGYVIVYRYRDDEKEHSAYVRAKQGRICLYAIEGDIISYQVHTILSQNGKEYRSLP